MRVPATHRDWRRTPTPPQGEYAPSTSAWARQQAELYERSGGAEGTTLRGTPVIALTSIGAKSGMLRKTVLKRVEHDGEYVALASLGGAPQHPVWHDNLTMQPQVELQDGPITRNHLAREVTGDAKARWWELTVARATPGARADAARLGPARGPHPATGHKPRG